VIDGNALAGYTTLEGPKVYKRDGWYFIFAPAGGVKQGWQSVFRSRHVAGPYEGRIVLAQGTSDINGPHQGALVDTPTGESWFLHFQDLDAYGRVVHLQPVTWRDGWPVIGVDPDGDGTGEPVRAFRKPDVGQQEPIAAPASSDEFDAATLGLQWQWQANPDASWFSLTARPGALRLNAVPSGGNLWTSPNLLLQKFPAPAFVATAAVAGERLRDGERAGLIVFGADYAWVGVRRRGPALAIVAATAPSAADGTPEREVVAAATTDATLYLRATVAEGAMVDFRYSTDNRTFVAIGAPFKATAGRWVGAKIGLFAARPRDATAGGYAAVDWFRIAGHP
jgi:beta-xylosidase